MLTKLSSISLMFFLMFIFIYGVVTFCCWLACVSAQLFILYIQLFFSPFFCSDGLTGTSLGARMLQGGMKKGLLLRNKQVE